MRRSAAVPVARFLMDQSKTAGIGNYVLSETLYKAAVYPWAKCGDLDTKAWQVHTVSKHALRRKGPAKLVDVPCSSSNILANKLGVSVRVVRLCTMQRWTPSRLPLRLRLQL